MIKTGPAANIANGSMTGMPTMISKRRPALSRMILHLVQSSLGLSISPGQPKGFNGLKCAFEYSLPQSQHH